MAPEKAPHVEKTKPSDKPGTKRKLEGPRIRCGFIGVGGRGTHLLGKVAKLRQVDVVAVCDLDKGCCERAAGVVEKAHGKRKGFKKPDLFNAGKDDYKNLLKRDDIDCVVSATPCFEHARIYLDCLATGKHTYGEKPMCISLKECNDLVASEAKSPAILQIGFQRRCNPRYIDAVKLVRAGELGEPVDARSAWSNAWGPLLGWFGRRKESGGWMLEQACHSWDVFNWATGGIAQWAYGWGRKDLYRDRQADRDVHDYYVATIGWHGGMVLQFLHSWIAAPEAGCSGVYEKICGLKAGVDFGSATFSYREKKDGKNVTKKVGKSVDDTLEALKTFFDCAKAGQQPPSGVHNGRDASLVGLLVQKAVDERRVVTMAEVVKG